MLVFARGTALLTVTVTALMVAHVAEITVWTIFYILAGLPVGEDMQPFEFAFENYYGAWLR